MDLPPFLLEIFGLFLTISVLLYLFVGDNALFRLVTYLFIGVVAGYVTIMILFNVLLPRLASLLSFQETHLFTAVGGVLALMGMLLFFKLSPRLSRFGDSANGDTGWDWGGCRDWWSCFWHDLRPGEQAR